MYKSKRPKKITIEYEDKAEKYIKSGVVVSFEPVMEKGGEKVKTDITMLSLTKAKLECAINMLQEILEEIK